MAFKSIRFNFHVPLIQAPLLAAPWPHVSPLPVGRRAHSKGDGAGAHRLRAEQSAGRDAGVLSVIVGAFISSSSVAGGAGQNVNLVTGIEELQCWAPGWRHWPEC